MGRTAVAVNPEPEARKPGIPIHPVVTIRANEINPAPYNPRRISPEMLESLKQAIRKHGFLEPLVVQRSSETFGPLILIGGHQRLRAVREIGIEDNRQLPDLPCIVLDVPDRTAKMLNVSLNNIAGEFDPKLLGELLEDVNRVHVIDLDEVLVMGFDEEDVSRYLHLAEPPQIDEDPPTFGTSVTLSLEFKDVRQRDAVKAKLLERAKLTRRTTGEVVDGLLGGTRRRKKR